MKEIKLKCKNTHDTFDSLIETLKRPKSNFSYQNFVKQDITIFIEPNFFVGGIHSGSPAVAFVVGKIYKESLNNLNPIVIVQPSSFYLWSRNAFVSIAIIIFFNFFNC